MDAISVHTTHGAHSMEILRSERQIIRLRFRTTVVFEKCYARFAAVAEVLLDIQSDELLKYSSADFALCNDASSENQSIG